MRIHLVNPSHVAFGVAIITPRWLYVLAGATPREWGDPVLTDETLEPFDPTQLERGDIVGIGIHTANALRGYEVGRLARVGGPTSSSAAFTPHSTPRKRRSWVEPTPW